jgi:hypothetical protein
LPENRVAADALIQTGYKALFRFGMVSRQQERDSVERS